MKIKGLVVDINGVLHNEKEPFFDTVRVFNKIKKKFPVRLVSNSTSKTQEESAQKMQNMGFCVKAHEIFTPIEAIHSYLLASKKGAFFISTAKTKESFKDIPSSPVDFVVVTHAHEEFTFQNLNQGFRYLRLGAKLIGSGSSKYYVDSYGHFNLDPGPFIYALEWASGSQALILGKPSPQFFLAAVKDMGLNPHEVAMVGDDIETDVQGGIKAGLLGVLVKTGKFCQKDLDKNITPHAILESFAHIETILNKKI